MVVDYICIISHFRQISIVRLAVKINCRICTLLHLLARLLLIPDRWCHFDLLPTKTRIVIRNIVYELKCVWEIHRNLRHLNRWCAQHLPGTKTGTQPRLKSSKCLNWGKQRNLSHAEFSRIKVEFWKFSVQRHAEHSSPFGLISSFKWYILPFK